MTQQQMGTTNEMLGYDSFFDASAAPFRREGLTIARVVTEHREGYLIKNSLGEFPAEVAGKLRYGAASREDFPAVGDWVAAAVLDDGQAIIHGVLERKTVLARKAAGTRTKRQIIAANVDTAFIVQGLDHNFNIRRLERYLVVVREGGVTPVVLLSKTDLWSADDIALFTDEATRAAPGVSVIPYSAVTRNGLDKVRSMVHKGKTVCFIGSSGVGKSTLINCLIGEELLPTHEVRETDSRGRHASSRRQMVLLPEGGILIDTPGMRELGVWNVDGSLEETFPEIGELAVRCQFRDCSHVHEPNCAVRASAEAGTLDPGRYESFLKLAKEAKFVASQATIAGRQEKKRKDKALSKSVRKVLKLKGKK